MGALDLIVDVARRPSGVAQEVLEGISSDALHRMPDERTNSIAWLVWHAARQQDVQISELAGTEQVWTSDGWARRLGLDRPEDAFGLGDGPAEVAAVHVEDPSCCVATSTPWWRPPSPTCTDCPTNNWTR